MTFLRASKGLFSPEAYHQMFTLLIKEQIHNANNNFWKEIDLAVNFRGRDGVTLRPLENILRIKRFIYFIYYSFSNSFARRASRETRPVLARAALYSNKGQIILNAFL